MEGTLRSAVSAACVTLGLAAFAGCSAWPSRAVRHGSQAGAAGEPRAAAGRSAPPADRELVAQRDAQRAWCSYLQALYLRADATAKAWPRFQECAEVKSTASPELLHQTADCAHRALDMFEGDPFTAAYAGEVSRCGTAALEAAAVTPLEVEPFVTALCGRAAACGEATLEDCRASFEPGLVINLERAVGAMNRRSREDLRACLRAPSCASLPDRISTCLEPIMAALLWLPD